MNVKKLLPGDLVQLDALELAHDLRGFKTGLIWDSDNYSALVLIPKINFHNLTTNYVGYVLPYIIVKQYSGYISTGRSIIKIISRGHKI